MLHKNEQCYGCRWVAALTFFSHFQWSELRPILFLHLYELRPENIYIYSQEKQMSLYWCFLMKSNLKWSIKTWLLTKFFRSMFFFCFNLNELSPKMFCVLWEKQRKSWLSWLIKSQYYLRFLFIFFFWRQESLKIYEWINQNLCSNATFSY